MTFDAVALCREQPTTEMTLGAMSSAGESLRVRTVERGGLLQLCADDGHVLATIEGPRLVQVPGEVRRLLGIDVADLPHAVWWVETWAPSHSRDGAAIAAAYVQALVARTGGHSWSTR